MPYKPRRTEEEALAEMSQRPGFELDEDGWGSKQMTPQGLVWARGARVNDETFLHETFGFLNISSAWRNVYDDPSPLHTIPINEGLMNNISKIDLDEEYLDQLTPERLAEPVLIVTGSDGFHIIDGSHRLTRLYRDGVKTAKARMLLPETLRYMRITTAIWRDGDWYPADTVSDEALEREIEGGKRMLARLMSGGA